MDMLELRHEARRAKWWKDLRRNDPPPFLGPLVSIKEAAEALDRSVSYVRSRIEDGRLNVWKDPVTLRVWILKDDVERLVGDNAALESAAKSRRVPRPKRNKEPDIEPEEEESEDLDAIGGWVAPEPRGAAGYLEDQEKEREAKYQQKQRETEEWYAAELAKLEGRDPEEAVRHLQIERGWLKPELTGEPDSADAPASPSLRRRGKGGGSRARPVSWSDPHAKPRTKPEPYNEPDAQSLINNPQSEIDRPFPIGWVSSKIACRMLQVCRVRLAQYVREGKVQRRLRPDGKLRYLYDSIEIERLADQRLDRQPKLMPNESYTHWGPRNRKVKLNEYDGWITSAEAATMLGITRQSLQKLIRKGKLPAYQKDPGKQGSKLYVPHNMVVRLRDNPTRTKNNEASQRGRAATQRQDEGWEEQGIEPYQESDSTPNTRKDWGEYYTTRQVAHLLGISVSSVHCLRLRGRLTGHRHTWRKPETGRQWWFFRKEDVHNLQADPEYNRHHRRFKKQFDKIWQDEPATESTHSPAAAFADTGWSWRDHDLPVW